MAPPNWAYQVDNFDPPPDEELVCSVCRSVFCDPVQSPCNHVFCRACINKWLESNRNCPICRKRTTKYTVQEVVPIVKNMIMKLALFCHNKENGCEEKFPLESCEAHLKVCAYETIRCSNRPCKEMLMRKDMKDHELNNCLHRYTRCQNCCLKISSVVPTKHNCVKALKARIRERNELIKKKSQKIRELEAEIKSLKEAQPESSSEISSLESLSAGDIMINLPSANDSFDSTSFGEDDSDGDDNSFQLSGFLSNTFSAFDDFFSNEEDSIEYLRASSPASQGNSSVVNPLNATFDDEPQVRRPTKRRLPVRTLDSSDEDNDGNMEPPPAPSPKRTSWRQILNDLNAAAGQSTSQAATGTQEAVAQCSVESSHLPSSSAAGSSRNDTQASNSNTTFKLRPRGVRRSSSEQASAAPLPPARRNSRGIFERTRALLEHYSLESDPEWLPENRMDAQDVESDSDSSFHPPVYPDGHFSTSSDSSSSDDSSSSSYVDAQSRTNMLRGLYSTSSSDDPDWIPP